MSVRASSVDVRLRLRGQRQFKKEVATSAATLEAMGLKGAKALGSFALQADKLKSFGRSWTRNVSMPVALGAGLAVKAAIDWESAFAGVEKTVSATPAQFKALEGGLRSMSTHIPVAATELAEIAEAAGQLGIKRKALLSFTRTVADLGVATNLAGEEGASTLARFANITQMPQSQFQRLGSTIVALGNAGASTEKDIANMGLRLAAAGNFAGMSEADILGIANALSSVGIEAEAGGTSMSTAIKTINSAVVGNTPLLEDFAEIAGMPAAQFAQSWKRDAAGTMTSWIEGLGRLKAEGKDVPSVLYDLGTTLRGTRVQDTLMRAAGAGKLLRESLHLGGKAWQQNNALTKEASKRYGTVKSKLQILKNQVIDAGVSLGQELLPPLIELVDFAGPKITELATAFGGLPGPVKAAAIGFLILTGPVASALGYFAGGVGRLLVGTGKLISFTKGIATFAKGFMALRAGAGTLAALDIALQGFGLTLKGVMLTSGIGLAIAAIFLLDQQFHFLGPTLEWVKGALGAAFGGIKTAGADVLEWIKGNWQLLALLTGPIGLVVVTVAAHFDTIKRVITGALGATLGFIKKWGPKAVGFLTNVWKSKAVQVLTWPIRTYIKFQMKLYETLRSVIGKALGFIKGAWPAVSNFLKDPIGNSIAFIKTAIGKLPGFFASMPGKLKAAASGMFGFLKEAFRTAINWVIDKWNGLEFRIPSVDLPGPGPSFGGQTIGMPDIPHLAGGGDILSPGVVEVGERGPELLHLPRAARVTPLEPAPINLSRATGGGIKKIVVQAVLPDMRVLAEGTADVAEDDGAYAP